MQQRNSPMPPPKQASGLPGRGLARAGGRPRKDWVRDQLGEEMWAKRRDYASHDAFVLAALLDPRKRAEYHRITPADR